MTVFFLVAAALGVVAAAWLTRSLWWPSRASGSAADGDAADALRAQRSPAFAVVLALFCFVVAGGGYALLGSPKHLGLGPQSSAEAAVAQQRDAEEQPKSREEALAKINVMLDKLVAHLKEQPDDADGWQLLARTYAALGKQPQAIESFKTAEKLRPTDATLLADYAVALAVANNRQLEGAPMALVERALKADPKHPKSLALAGTAAFGRKDYKGAVKYWETLQQVEPPDSPIHEQVRASIAEARQLAGMPAAAGGAADPTAAAQASAAGSAQVSGTVTLADSLKGRVSPDDTVFIFARASDGPRMPLAIIRKQVKDLPVQFTLDDSLAMSPAAKLSGVKSVVVGARISKSGNAMPQTGDLQGLVPGVAVGTNGVKVEISASVQ